MPDVDPLQGLGAGTKGVPVNDGTTNGGGADSKEFKVALEKFAMMLLQGPIMDAAGAFAEDPSGGGSDS